MKKVFISLGILLCLNSCIDYTSTQDIKVGQMYECGENPYKRDTIAITSIREDYFQFYSTKRRSIITENLFNLVYEIDCQNCKLIKKL
jgi:hypothetical protein